MPESHIKYTKGNYWTVENIKGWHKRCYRAELQRKLKAQHPTAARSNCQNTKKEGLKSKIMQTRAENVRDYSKWGKRCSGRFFLPDDVNVTYMFKFRRRNKEYFSNGGSFSAFIDYGSHMKREKCAI